MGKCFTPPVSKDRAASAKRAAAIGVLGRKAPSGKPVVDAATPWAGTLSTEQMAGIDWVEALDLFSALDPMTQRRLLDGFGVADASEIYAAGPGRVGQFLDAVRPIYAAIYADAAVTAVPRAVGCAMRPVAPAGMTLDAELIHPSQVHSTALLTRPAGDVVSPGSVTVSGVTSQSACTAMGGASAVWDAEVSACTYVPGTAAGMSTVAKVGLAVAGGTAAAALLWLATRPASRRR